MDLVDEVMQKVDEHGKNVAVDEFSQFLSDLIERLEMRLDAVEKEMEEELDEED